MNQRDDANPAYLAPSMGPTLWTYRVNLTGPELLPGLG